MVWVGGPPRALPQALPAVPLQPKRQQQLDWQAGSEPVPPTGKLRASYFGTALTGEPLLCARGHDDGVKVRVLSDELSPGMLVTKHHLWLEHERITVLSPVKQ